MAQTKIDGLLFREMVMAGAVLLEKNKESVDALNVFPVPDGDTGTNMTLTAQAAVREMNAHDYPRLDEAADALAKGALRGARGNSGVILSQLFRGFARSVAGLQDADAAQVAQALKSGADTAYKAVMKPKEGTILTVARVIAETAILRAQSAPADMEGLFATVLSSGEAILAKTQDMLPILKQAGVVDAGGRGLMLIYTGMNAALRGEVIETVTMSEDGAASFEDDHDAIAELKYIYCTEFLIDRIRPDATEDDIALFRRKLKRIGDCVFVVGDLALIKVHVHTNDPGKALQAGLALGELVNLKIENMAEQRRERARMEAEKAPDKEYGIISVSLGEGFSQMFTEMGVDKIVDGGQTMNPSIESLVSAIDSVHAKNVFVFPNNGNVILAAQQAAEISKRNVYVIPTKNVAMGLAGVLQFSAAATPEENLAAMTEAAEHVRSGMITTAIRDTQFEELTIHEGDVIGLYNGKISVCDKTPDEVARKLMDMMVDDETALISVFYGEGATEEQAQKLAEEFGKKYPDCDVEVQNGGQPTYCYLLAVE